MLTASQIKTLDRRGPLPTALEEHIDDPIKRAVALMNLYGIKTIFSCCGYKYKGEKVPKSHIQNQPQIMFKATRDGMFKAANLIHCTEFANGNLWMVFLKPTTSRERFAKASIMCSFRPQPTGQINEWLDKDSPHNHEGANAVIASLEDRLLEFRDTFKDEVLVRDYNAEMKKWYPHWQYPTCDPWLVKKSDFV